MNPYHVVLNVDKNFVKYSSVLIYSIILKTNLNKPGSPYHFHILTADADEFQIAQLHTFENHISKIYPSKIFVHKIDDSQFVGLPSWHGTNYATYYRLCLDSFLPANVSKCVYLDADIIVNSDLRDIYLFDLENKIAAVCDATYRDVSQPLKPVSPNNPEFYFKSSCHFNSGVMLINLELYREYTIQEKCLSFCKAYKPSVTPDEIALNAVIDPEYILKLPLAYNFYVGMGVMRDLLKIDFAFQDEIRINGFQTTFSKSEYYSAQNNPKIIHYAFHIPKPWDVCLYHLDYQFLPLDYPFLNDWWSLASQTPVFKTDIENIKNDYNESALNRYIVGLSLKLQKIESDINTIKKLVASNA
jgi:lipopolysaccharide biosynthesis glycosyltransferase